jgi:hypothetical protein
MMPDALDALRCATCGRALGGDPDEDRAVTPADRSRRMRARNDFFAMDIAEATWTA